MHTLQNIPWNNLQHSFISWTNTFFSGQDILWDKKVDFCLLHFPELLEACHTTSSPLIQSLPVTVFAQALACIAFGIDTSYQPTDVVWQHLHHLACTHHPLDTPESRLDLVIAYGCGWSRTPVSGTDPWSGRWENAVLALTSMVEKSVRQTIEQLKRLNVFEGTPERSLLEQSSTIRSIAQLLTQELIHNLHKTQRLEIWEPALPLRHFVTNAVAGYRPGSDNRRLNNPGLWGGGFRESLLYPLLTKEIGLCIGRVEFKICHVYHKDRIQEVLQESQQQPRRRPAHLSIQGLTHLYKGNRCDCDECGSQDDPEYTYHIARNNWILIPYDHGGMYHVESRWRCPACGNLYANPEKIEETKNIKQFLEMMQDEEKYQELLQNPQIVNTLREKLKLTDAQLRRLKPHTLIQRLRKQQARCPLCKHPSCSQRPTYVWVYRPGTRRLLDNRDPDET